MWDFLQTGRRRSAGQQAVSDIQRQPAAAAAAGQHAAAGALRWRVEQCQEVLWHA